MNRMFSKDAYALGMYYVYALSNDERTIVKLEDLKKFHNAIESNLEESKSTSYDMYATVRHDNDKPIYSTHKDQNGEIYCILDPKFDSYKFGEKQVYFACKDQNGKMRGISYQKFDSCKSGREQVINLKNCLSKDVIKASMMPNALECLGIEIENKRKFKQRIKTIKR